MSKFKIGDRVKKVKNTYMGMTPGDTDIIIDYKDGEGYTLQKYGSGHGDYFFELVCSETPAKVELNYEIY